MKKEELLSKVYSKKVNLLEGVDEKLVQNLLACGYVKSDAKEDWETKLPKEIIEYLAENNLSVSLSPLEVFRLRYKEGCLSKGDYCYYRDSVNDVIGLGKVLKYVGKSGTNLVFNIITPYLYRDAKLPYLIL